MDILQPKHHLYLFVRSFHSNKNSLFSMYRFDQYDSAIVSERSAEFESVLYWSKATANILNSSGRYLHSMDASWQTSLSHCYEQTTCKCKQFNKSSSSQSMILKSKRPERIENPPEQVDYKFRRLYFFHFIRFTCTKKC